MAIFVTTEIHPELERGRRRDSIILRQVEAEAVVGRAMKFTAPPARLVR